MHPHLILAQDTAYAQSYQSVPSEVTAAMVLVPLKTPVEMALGINIIQ